FVPSYALLHKGSHTRSSLEKNSRHRPLPPLVAPISPPPPQWRSPRLLPSSSQGGHHHRQLCSLLCSSSQRLPY
ncbi:hypothetical protein KQY10_20350, partial [Leptospira interrogans]|nr:hypothetical protein [Leptospira interrogans]